MLIVRFHKIFSAEYTHLLKRLSGYSLGWENNEYKGHCACITTYHNLSKANYSANFRMPFKSLGNRSTAYMYWNDASQTSKLNQVLAEILLQDAGTTFLIMALSDSQCIPPRNIIQTQTPLTIDCELCWLEHTKQRPITNDGVYTQAPQRIHQFRQSETISCKENGDNNISRFV